MPFQHQMNNNSQEMDFSLSFLLVNSIMYSITGLLPLESSNSFLGEKHLSLAIVMKSLVLGFVAVLLKIQLLL